MWTVAIACSFFLFSYGFVFRYLANENILTATIYNSFAIIFFLIIEKAGTVSRKETQKKKPSAFWQHLWFAGGVSNKSVLYLFFIWLLMCMAIVAAEPDFPVLGNMKGYFESTQYGFLILIATDAYLEQVFKDRSKTQK